MGQGQSAASGGPGGPKGFGVRMTPAVLEQAGSSANGLEAPSGVSNEALQQAFQQGVEYAHQQYAQAASEQHQASRQQRVELLEETNKETARKVRERTEELQKREYRAPVASLACKDEREAALLCFRESKGKAAGEIVINCQQVSDDLERCAALVREAAVSKIVAGSLDMRAQS